MVSVPIVQLTLERVALLQQRLLFGVRSSTIAAKSRQNAPLFDPGPGQGFAADEFGQLRRHLKAAAIDPISHGFKISCILQFCPACLRFGMSRERGQSSGSGGAQAAHRASRGRPVATATTAASMKVR
jgi:hypothetical protein